MWRPHRLTEKWMFRWSTYGVSVSRSSVLNVTELKIPFVTRRRYAIPGGAVEARAHVPAVVWLGTTAIDSGRGDDAARAASCATRSASPIGRRG
ncbi:hypothetical protein MTE01_02170 [Microbacterium testaceum]|uniref:Uncharacterized protein n=1 Tax=Microbacterium testaceum TaxID=2033 RepID=A0A4Y3QGJ1_MICTE|nr:hypothetical protein MTE01_02170 [Microbacterium testaceum]